MKMFPADIWEYPIPKIGNFSFRFLGKTLDGIQYRWTAVEKRICDRQRAQTAVMIPNSTRAFVYPTN